jgi:hypothetical protein
MTLDDLKDSKLLTDKFDHIEKFNPDYFRSYVLKYNIGDFSIDLMKYCKNV